MTPASAHQNQGLGVTLMVCSAMLACLGQTLWKVGASQGWWWIAGGLVLYGAGALLMIVAYRHGELSTLQPVLGLSYALSLVIGVVWLAEPFSVGRLLGVVAVIVGVVLVARSRSADPLVPAATPGLEGAHREETTP